MKQGFYLMLMCSAFAVVGQENVILTQFHKKIIEMRREAPTPSEVVKAQANNKSLPFDGIVMRFPKNNMAGRMFRGDRVTEEECEKDLKALDLLKNKKQNYNFLILNTTENFNWFDEKACETLLHNVTFIVDAAVRGNCAGIVLDPEPSYNYTCNPWVYKKHLLNNKSFEECQKRVRECGGRVMNAIQQKMPNAVIHILFLFTYYRAMFDLNDSKTVNARLENSYYALWPSFVNGMLDNVKPGIILTEGNESAYYYKTPEDFYRGYHMIRNRELSFVAPENHSRYRMQVFAAQGVYPDEYFAPGSVRTLGYYMTLMEQTLWTEHNIYYAMLTSDRFTWVYTNMKESSKYYGNYLDAVYSAKEKMKHQKTLDFDLNAVFSNADKKMIEDYKKVQTRSARILKVDTETQTPVADGKMNPDFWSKIPVLDTFSRRVMDKVRTCDAKTEVKVAYDDKNLYLAFSFAEPHMWQIKQYAKDFRENVWNDDNITLFFAPQKGKTVPYYRFVLNPGNVRYTGRHSHQDDGKGNEILIPAWTSAVIKGKDSWSGWLAVPWDEMKMKAPASGESYRVNVYRNRRGNGKHYSWSQWINGPDPQYFGTWIF